MRRFAPVLALLWSGSAGAQSADIDLHWTGPAGCPDEPEIRRRIVAAADSAELLAVRVTAVAGKTGGSWRAEVWIGDERRVLTGSTCDEVAAAAALVIGLALRHVVDEAPEPIQEDPPAPRPLPPIDTADRELRVRRGAGSVPTPVRFAAAAGAGVEIGTLPGVAATASAGAEIAGRRLGLRLGVSYGTSSAPAEPDGPFSSARVTRLAGIGRLCVSVHPLSVCAGAEVGRMAAAVASAEDRDAGSGLWIAAVAGAGLGVSLTRRLELALEADLVIPLAYPQFSVNRTESLEAPGMLGGRTAAGLRVHFW